MKVIDLCSGLGGATEYFRVRGHDVFAVDIVADFNPELIGDVRDLTVADFPFKPDFVWASPPCTEFTKCCMPWYKDKNPDMSIVEACIRLIDELSPAYFVLENVRGARPFINPLLGKPKKCGSYYLWGHFPIFDAHVIKRKQSITGLKPELRAKVPFEIGKALCLALELEIENNLCPASSEGVVG